MAIGRVSKKGRVSEDTAIGVFSASAMALAVLFIGLKEATMWTFLAVSSQW
jgi:ABC-type Mn2+/Zn2+ transport system permease subunit